MSKHIYTEDDVVAAMYVCDVDCYDTEGMNVTDESLVWYHEALYQDFLTDEEKQRFTEHVYTPALEKFKRGKVVLEQVQLKTSGSFDASLSGSLRYKELERLAQAPIICGHTGYVATSRQGYFCTLVAK